jgi:hypothetical protein
LFCASLNSPTLKFREVLHGNGTALRPSLPKAHKHGGAPSILSTRLRSSRYALDQMQTSAAPSERAAYFIGIFFGSAVS